jgi:hypothetical protein
MTQQAAEQPSPARMALAKWGGKAYEKPAEVTTALAQLAEHFPVIAPGGTTSCAAIAEGCRVLLTSVVAYPPERGNDGKEIQGTGDVFKDAQTGKWCFHAAFLKKLAAGVGIEWLAEKTRRLDNFSNPFVCSMVVAGRYRDYTGEWREISGSHQLDLRDEAAHGKTPNQLKKARQYIQQLCETMAKSRAIADACVSRTISENDLGRPIPMAKLYRVDALDAGAAKAALYGPGAGGDGIESARPAEVIEETTGEVTTQGRTTDNAGSRGAAEGEAPRGQSSGSSSGAPAGASASPASDPTKFIIGKGLPGEGKSFAEATDDELVVYVEAAKKKYDAESAKWTEKGREGAMAKISAAHDEIDRRMAKGQGAAEGV